MSYYVSYNYFMITVFIVALDKRLCGFTLVIMKVSHDVLLDRLHKIEPNLDGYMNHFL